MGEKIDIDKGMHEAGVGLELEGKGKLDNIIRDSTGKAEFIEQSGNGQKWDVKSFNSNYKPKKGGFELDGAMKTINDSLADDENVILDISNMSQEHITLLLAELEKYSLMGHIIVWP